MKLGRNEPCHCGSGKKYKQCHYNEDRAATVGRAGETAMDVAIDRMEAQAKAESGPLKIGLLVSGIVVAVAVGLWQDTGAGLIVGAAWFLAAGAYLSFRNPPPPNVNAGDPAALNFGMSSKSEDDKKKKKKR